MCNTYGYIRISSKDQNEDRQVIALRDFGVTDNHIYTDKQSGKDFDRPKYKQLIKRLKPDDILVIKSIDRLGRNFFEILEQWKMITVDKKAAIVIIDMPILDTRKQKNDLTSQLISSLVLQLLSYVAQVERDFIRQRQREGIDAARARGIKFGRSPMVRPVQFDNVRESWKQGKISARAAARQLNISHSTFLRWVKE